jgi:hypothetical protein
MSDFTPEVILCNAARSDKELSRCGMACLAIADSCG